MLHYVPSVTPGYRRLQRTWHACLVWCCQRIHKRCNFCGYTIADLRNELMFREIRNELMFKEIRSEFMFKEIRSELMFKEICNELMFKEIRNELMFKEIGSELMFKEICNVLMFKEIRSELMFKEIKLQGENFTAMKYSLITFFPVSCTTQHWCLVLGAAF